MIVFHNGKMLESNNAFISIESQGFLYGYGLFETIRVFQGRILFFDEHIKRLLKSCQAMDMTFEYHPQSLLNSAYSLINANKMTDGALKIIYSRTKDGYDITMTVRKNPYGKEVYHKGFNVCISQYRRNPFSLLTGVKSLNYAENILEKSKSASKGFNEVLFLNCFEQVSEGAISNIFWVHENKLYTPSKECGLLAGITRQQIMELAARNRIDTVTGRFGLDRLKEAQEIFLTNSLMGIMPVSLLEDSQLNMDNFAITNLLAEQYANYMLEDFNGHC